MDSQFETIGRHITGGHGAGAPTGGRTWRIKGRPIRLRSGQAGSKIVGEGTSERWADDIRVYQRSSGSRAICV